MDWSLVSAPVSIVGWGLGLALFSFVYSLVLWRRDKPFGRWQWQEFPPIAALASLVFASATLCVWWALHTDTPATFGEVVLAGVVAVFSAAPAWAYQRDNKHFSVRLLPYIGSYLAASIGVSLFLQTFALYVQQGWQKKLLDFLFEGNQVGIYVLAVVWPVLWLWVRLEWAKPTKPARQPRD